MCPHHPLSLQDYSIITSVIDKRGGSGTSNSAITPTDIIFLADTNVYDYDYGQPRLIPETAAVTTRTRSNLDNERGR